MIHPSHHTLRTQRGDSVADIGELRPRLERGSPALQVAKQLARHFRVGGLAWRVFKQKHGIRRKYTPRTMHHAYPTHRHSNTMIHKLPGRNLHQEMPTTILHAKIREFQSEQLHVGITMCKTFFQSAHGFFGWDLFAADAVADFQFEGEVFLACYESGEAR